MLSAKIVYRDANQLDSAVSELWSAESTLPSLESMSLPLNAIEEDDATSRTKPPFIAKTQTLLNDLGKGTDEIFRSQLEPIYAMTGRYEEPEGNFEPPAMKRSNSSIRIKLDDVASQPRPRGRPPKNKRKRSSGSSGLGTMSPEVDEKEVPSADEDWQPPGLTPVASGSGSGGRGASAVPDTSSGWMQDALGANQTVSPPLHIAMGHDVERVDS